MTSYTNHFHGNSSVNSHFLLRMLPHLTNLTHLDLSNVLYEPLNLEKKFDHDEPFDAVDLKHLKILRICLNMFTLLRGTLVKFSRKKLETLFINGSQYISVLNPEDSAVLKAFITSQSNLKDLKLRCLSNEILFNTPMMTDFQLKSFAIKDCFCSFCVSAYNPSSSHRSVWRK